MYRFTEKMFKEVKAERFYVIAFENGKRVSTFGACHMLDAFNEVMKTQGMNRTVLVVNAKHVEARQEDRCCIERDIESFADLFELAKKDGRNF